MFLAQVPILNDSKRVEIAVLADKLSNMRAISRDCENEGEKLSDRFNAAKESQSGYYKSYCRQKAAVQETFTLLYTIGIV